MPEVQPAKLHLSSLTDCATTPHWFVQNLLPRKPRWETSSPSVYSLGFRTDQLRPRPIAPLYDSNRIYNAITWTDIVRFAVCDGASLRKLLLMSVHGPSLKLTQFCVLLKIVLLCRAYETL